MNVNERIETLKIVPVVVIQDAKDAVPLAKALTAGGLSVAEVTFRTDAAEASIKAMNFRICWWERELSRMWNRRKRP